MHSKNKYPIWHPFKNQADASLPIKIVQAKKTLLIDENNNKYIDTISSWWVNIHGHAHPTIAKAIYDQAKKLEQIIFANFTHEPAIRLANKVLDLWDQHFEKVFFSDNGSTAVEVAMKMAIQYLSIKKSKRKKILALQNSYHGDTFGAMSVGARGKFSSVFNDYLFDIQYIDLYAVDCLEQLKKKDLNDYAFFIYEPLVQGAGGMKIHTAEKINSILKTLKQHDVLLIADEVMTGWGRSGTIFASQQIATKPDFICLSKGLTGGFLPLSITLTTKKIHSAFVNKKEPIIFYHGHSFTANPIGCASAIESIRLLLLPTTLKKIKWMSESHTAFLEKIKNKTNVFNARICGTILAFEFNQKDAFYETNFASSITNYFLNYEIFIRPLGNTIYLMPPYCISKQELNKVYKIILRFLDEF